MFDTGHNLARLNGYSIPSEFSKLLCLLSTIGEIRREKWESLPSTGFKFDPPPPQKKKPFLGIYCPTKISKLTVQEQICPPCTSGSFHGQSPERRHPTPVTNG